MRKGIRFAVLVVATVCLMAAFATSAYAYSGYYVPCGSCHAVASGATVTATEVSNDGTTATYDITTTGATQWAVFAGYTRVAYGLNTTGTITVPAGATYSIYAVSDSPTTGKYGTANITPASSWVEPANSDVTPPVSSSDAVAAYTDKATISITASDPDGAEGTAWGVAYIYYKVDGGLTRTTPIGTSGTAVAVVAPNVGGTTSHTIEYWAQDRAGNTEDPAQTKTFTITRAAAVVGSNNTPSVISDNGDSKWSYQDLRDSFAKYQGGYVAFGGVSGWYANPHGGYSTTTNKCKVCHAVHRAEGAYYLLRADSQDDACVYCHIGGSAHSSKVVYTQPQGVYAPNGHTMGASTSVPDSSVKQWTAPVTLETLGSDGRTVVTEDINVRQYDEAEVSMYRFGYHHSHQVAATPNGWSKIGPLALRCMNCHQVHNASEQIWKPPFVTAANGSHPATGSATVGYKLLKLFPSGSTVGAGTDSHGTLVYANNQLVAVPETTLTADVNFSTTESNAGTMVGSNGQTHAFPTWVAQEFPAEIGDMSNAALSAWCADCHNLNIGYATEGLPTELGGKAHTERTHPAPYTGSHDGPAQCYSCHRNDLPAVNPGGTNCETCHMGTGTYNEVREAGSYDFPHSGDSYKMLGNFSVSFTTSHNGTLIPVTITSSNLDAVCKRCHYGIGMRK